MKEGLFSEIIVDWYEHHHRSLPWRNTRDPYKIWLSEIILQQTRVAQGLPYYKRFLQHYPNVKSLAQANEQQVLRLWQGLGYYSRARNLHACAKKIVHDHGGKFPKTFTALKHLPGIGDYTAAAIASFAFDEPVAVVDGNVYRVLSRVFGIDKDIASPEGKKFFAKKANELIPSHRPAIHNQAVMEFGALHCTPQQPKCEDCVLAKHCYAKIHQMQNDLPVKQKSQKITKRYFYYWVIETGKKLLMNERSGKDIWKGLHDFPLHEEKRAIGTKKILSYHFSPSGLSTLKPEVSSSYKHVLSHQIIFATFIALRLPFSKKLPPALSSAKAKWVSAKQIAELPKPVLISRYLKDKNWLP